MKKEIISECVCSIMVYGSDTLAAKKEDVIRQERNDARMVRWMYNVRTKDKIFSEELRIG